jgi:tripartite-type tricarboxylate transporter receptor subunit TctC
MRWAPLHMPDIPIVSDFLPGYEASSCHGVGLPKDASAEIIEKLNNQINAALADTAMKVRLDELGGTALRGSPGTSESSLAPKLISGASW